MSDSSNFLALPPQLKRRIDRAFETIASDELPESHSPQSPHKKRKVDIGASVSGDLGIQPGGFIVEEPLGRVLADEDTIPRAGGFIVDDVEDGEAFQRSHILLSRIPAALQLLDLQPDDEEVLSVFRNAASGWTSRRSHSLPDQTLGREVVSREDWRAVCAVLLEPHVDEHESTDTGGNTTGYGGPGASSWNLSEEDESDEYQEEELYSNGRESDFYGSDEEYIDGTSTSGPRSHSGLKSTHIRKLRRSSTQPPSSSTQIARKLTSRQTEECRRTFALFFPDVPANSDELDKKRIMIKDMSRVATVLKEKITVEEVVEMLEAFSTSADKSMSLKDFERMMLAAKLA